MIEYPEYYKNIVFKTIDGRMYKGYFEPPFDADGEPFFVHEEDTKNKGCEPYGLFFSVDTIRDWNYTED